MLQFPTLPNIAKYAEKLKKIEVMSGVLQYLPVSGDLKKQLLHFQVLKSSLFSARIEGNTLTLVTAKNLDLKNPKEKEKKEISNVLKALSKLQSSMSKISISQSSMPHNSKIQSPNVVDSVVTKDNPVFSENWLLEIHRQVMQNLDADAGSFRREASAIFDQYGNIVYLTPNPEEMKQMLAVLLDRIELTQSGFATSMSWQEKLFSVVACHYYFEKIHPFVDGNGRTGRILLQYQLQKLGIFSDYILAVDQYFDEHKSEYYLHLEKNSRNIEGFVDFFLDAVIFSIQKILDEVKAGVSAAADSSNIAGNVSITSSKSSNFSLENLLPRRKEIYLVIKDHPYITADGVARRFAKIPKRTLAYDLSQLVKLGLVQKLGKTRGVVYVMAGVSG